MFAQLYNINTRFGTEILEVFWKVFFITYFVVTGLGFNRDVTTDGLISALFIVIFKMNFVLVARVIYEILYKFLDDSNVDILDKMDEISKATWKIHKDLKKCN